MNDRRPGEGRYAHLEREQRWTLAGLPAEVVRSAEIVDRYISGTRLRLRRTQTDRGLAFKLGQKVRVEPDDPEMVKLTNLYLSAEEYDQLTALPAAVLRKTRWHSDWDGSDVAIDEFDGRLRGLVLAEIELAVDEVRRPVPPFALRDVTGDDRFSGGALAFASDDALEALMREVGLGAALPREDQADPNA